MADPVVSYYESDDTTELNTANPEDFGNIIMGQESDPKVIHIWNDKGGGAGSTTMYNVRIKIVTATGLDSGDTLANGQELVEDQWIEGKSITNNDVSYVPLGNGATLELGNIAANAFHSIELKEIVPSDATSVPPSGDITFELYVLYDLTEA
jgi:hypothetical protein